MFILTSCNMTHIKLSDLSALCATVNIFILIRLHGGLGCSIYTSSGCGLYACKESNKKILRQERLTMTEASTYWLPIAPGASNFLVKPMTSASIYRTPRLVFLFFRAARSEWGSNQPSPCKPVQGKQTNDRHIRKNVLD